MKKIMWILIGLLVISSVIGAIQFTSNRAVEELAIKKGMTQEEVEQELIDTHAPDELKHMWEVEIQDMLYECTKNIDTYNACKTALEKII